MKFERRMLGRTIGICGAIAIGLATLTPSTQRATTETMCLVCGELGGVDIVLNVLLFAPLGAGLAMAGVRWRRAVPAMVATTILIELLQLTIVAGRDASFGDIAANALGGILGYAVGANAARLFGPDRSLAGRLAISWLCGWVALQGLSAMAMVPSPTTSPYFGQLARALGEEPAYPGRVLSATLGGEPVPDRDLENWKQLASSLRSDAGAELVVVVEETAAPPRATSIARIADAREEEVLGLTRDGPHAQFGIRTRAADLRLRPQYFRLDGAFPTKDTTHGVTRLRARYAPPVVQISAEHAGGIATTRIRLSASSGWRLFALSDIDYDASSRAALLDALWLAALLLPAGYWLACAFAGGRGNASTVPLMLISVTLAASGFAVGPLCFGTATPAWWESVGALAGLAAGAGVSRLARSFREEIVGDAAQAFAARE